MLPAPELPKEPQTRDRRDPTSETERPSRPHQDRGHHGRPRQVDCTTDFLLAHISVLRSQPRGPAASEGGPVISSFAICWKTQPFAWRCWDREQNGVPRTRHRGTPSAPASSQPRGRGDSRCCDKHVGDREAPLCQSWGNLSLFTLFYRWGT